MEEKYRQFERLARELKIPVMEVFLKFEVKKEGKILQTYRERSHTWNRNFWNVNLWFFGTLTTVVTNFGAGYISLKKTDGNVASINPIGNSFSNVGVAGNNTYGIQVGIGTAAESFEGYVLNTLVAHGTGTNQLVYSAHSAIVTSYDAPTKKWTITVKRIFNNNSAGNIVITESGLTYNLSQVGSTYYLLNRDLLASAVTVNVGAQLTAQYLLTLTLPA